MEDASPGTTKIPTEFDVLLGRGTGSSQFEGNKRFRQLVNDRRKQYLSSNKRSFKNAIARELHDEIHSKGGTFLKLQEEASARDDGIVAGGTWVVVDYDTALEKCKMALRQQQQSEEQKSNAKKKRKKKQPEPSLPQVEIVRQHEEDEQMQNSFSDNSNLTQNCGGSTIVAGGNNDISTVPLAVRLSSMPIHARLPSLFQLTYRTIAPTMDAQASEVSPKSGSGATSRLPQHRERYNRQSQRFAHTDLDLVAHLIYPSEPSQLDLVARQYSISSSSYQNPNLNCVPSVVGTVPVDNGLSGTFSGFNEYGQELPHSSEMIARAPPAAEAKAQQKSNLPSLHEDAIFTLASLAVADRPKITEEELAKEQASLTEAERVAALTDMFGKHSLVGPPPVKRIRENGDSMEALVNQMRLELDIIPSNQKAALLGAQAKCRPEEFSDARLEVFLRCENLDVQLGAQRFVNYWQRRRQIFGPTKYILPMTLRGALSDDLAAMEAGMFQILPRLDLSGRALLFVDSHRNTRRGYSSESMLRVLWYMLELISEKTTDSSSGFILLMWDGDTSIADFDLKLFEHASRLECSRCYPVKALTNHLCSLTYFVRKIMKPIVFAVMTKEARARTLVHDDENSNYVGVLSQFGITREMLPIEMGGTVRLDQRQWMVERRAIELDEIE
jgi:hypothetical protein